MRGYFIGLSVVFGYFATALLRGGTDFAYFLPHFGDMPAIIGFAIAFFGACHFLARKSPASPGKN